MKLTYDEKQQVFSHLARHDLWRHEDVADRLITNFKARHTAAPSGPAPEQPKSATAPSADQPDSSAPTPLWSHILTEKITFSFQDFPWLARGAGYDKLRLILAFDLGLDRGMEARSLRETIDTGTPSAFTPWRLTTEFNGGNIALSRQFSLEPVANGETVTGICVGTNVTNKYAALAKTQLFLLAGAGTAQPWEGGLPLARMLKCLDAAPPLTVAGAEHNRWRAFNLYTRAPGDALHETHNIFGTQLGLASDSYAALDCGHGHILCGVEEDAYQRIATAAATSLRALHAIRTGKCADWEALGRDMAAHGADLKYVDPETALRTGDPFNGSDLDAADLHAADLDGADPGSAFAKDAHCLTDLMTIYGRTALLAAYRTAQNDPGSSGPAAAPPPPAP